MENLMREEMVKTTVDAAENVVENVVVSGSKAGKVALIVGGTILVGLGIHKVITFAKKKKADKNETTETADNVVAPEFESNGDEDSDK